MTERRPILLVGLDACDPRTARQLAAEGRMPVLRELLRRAARAPVRLPFGLFVGGLWPSFETGLRPDGHGLHCWDEIEIASYERRLTSVTRKKGMPFWERLGAAGRRVATVDVPHTVVAALSHGLHIAEWGCHDRHLGLASGAAGAAGRLERDFGLHPIFGMDARARRSFAPDDYIHRAGPLRDADEDAQLVDGLIRGAEIKGRLSRALLEAEKWDLFITVFGESHAVGHQQWHLHDHGHPRFDAARRAAIGGDPVVRVYAALDAALGELLSSAGEETLVLVLLSHGMGPHHDGTHLLDEVLRRIDLADRTAASGGCWGTASKRALHGLPPWLQRAAARLALASLRRRARERALAPAREFVSAAERAEQRFFLEPNNYVYGGVRLNQAGREPRGRVAPEETAAVAAALKRDLMALVNVANGRRVIRGVERADGRYDRSATDTIPDLFLDWERTTPIETVWSAKTGLVHAPYLHWRTGDHRPGGLLLVAGPGLPPGRELPGIAIEDLPASLAARLGCDPAGMHGRPVPWLAA